ncbi:MAG TPA: Stp1/IreP family PP2C-type Ser/Thr phosphatase [Spirochaetota bacterium]|nr:Stp1/IreP family PP2C-type Ser/Thr phosphatase [Spirochaetota bacterium]
MDIRAAGKTDRGTVRPVNEDDLLVDEKINLFIVADGMGGHEAGDVASKMLINEAKQFLYGKIRDGIPAEKISMLLEEALQNANLKIYTYSKNHGSGRIMGTTAVLMALTDNQYFISWVGDSRAYLMRDGLMERLTRDHSYVQQLVDSGEISEKEARVHPRRNMVTRAAGVEEEIEVETVWGQSRVGDLFLLCTDGLTGPLEDGVIAAHLESGGKDAPGDEPGSEPDVITDALIRDALEEGGDDNVTVVIVELL